MLTVAIDALESLCTGCGELTLEPHPNGLLVVASSSSNVDGEEHVSDLLNDDLDRVDVVIDPGMEAEESGNFGHGLWGYSNITVGLGDDDGLEGSGDDHPPNGDPDRVRATAATTLAHELGHHKDGANGQAENAMEEENNARRRLSTPGNSLGERTGCDHNPPMPHCPCSGG